MRIVYLNGQPVLDVNKVADESDATDNNESGFVGIGVEDAEEGVDAGIVERGGGKDVGQAVKYGGEGERGGGGEEKSLGAQE